MEGTEPIWSTIKFYRYILLQTIKTKIRIDPEDEDEVPPRRR